MTGPTLRLRHSDVLHALEEFDLLDAVAQNLIWRTGGGPHEPRTSRFVPDGGAAAEEELTAVEDVDTGDTCLLPTSSLRMIRSAGLAGLAAKELHAPGVVTAAVLGSSSAGQLYPSVIARNVPNLSHVAIYAGGATPGPTVDRGLREQLELAGIGLSITTSARRAASGANLVVLTDPDADHPYLGQLAPGTLVVNATGRDLPDELVTSVDQVYVDDLGLLDENQHRSVVRMHRTGADAAGPLLNQREGWHRHEAGWRHERRIEADLRQVLTGAHGRKHIDDIILVELLGLDVPDITLASRIHQTAVKYRLGRRTDAAEEE
jgi:ornithine cyclodeaminase/alanine dehydrogenase-like protein (mu-crystallin family)